MSEVSNSAPVESSESQSETPESSAPPVSAKRQFKYKADGAEVTEELDDAELSNRLSLAKAAHKRMQESAKILKKKRHLNAR
jgi:hypothetical protein